MAYPNERLVSVFAGRLAMIRLGRYADVVTLLRPLYGGCWENRFFAISCPFENLISKARVLSVNYARST